MWNKWCKVGDWIRLEGRTAGRPRKTSRNGNATVGICVRDHQQVVHDVLLFPWQNNGCQWIVKLPNVMAYKKTDISSRAASSRNSGRDTRPIHVTLGKCNVLHCACTAVCNQRLLQQAAVPRPTCSYLHASYWLHILLPALVYDNFPLKF